MTAMTRTLYAAAALAAGLAGAALADAGAEADALLQQRFDTAALADLDSPAAIDLWAETALLDGSTDAALDQASETGVELVLAALLDQNLALPVLERSAAETAPVLFGILFHPALLEELVTESPARQAAWDAAADALEARYFVRETTDVALAR